MSWHKPPRDEAWRDVHLDYLARTSQRAWLHCTACGHEAVLKPQELMTRHQIPATMPLLSIASRLVCSRCGARKAHCWPQPYCSDRG